MTPTMDNFQKGFDIFIEGEIVWALFIAFETLPKIFGLLVLSRCVGVVTFAIYATLAIFAISISRPA
jgi:hypothetical protein